MQTRVIAPAAAGLWIYSKAGDPTTTDIPTQAIGQLWLNTSTGVVKLWVNLNGTLKSVALA